MKILLSGGGSPEQVKPLDEYFANQMRGGIVLYIPIAMDKDRYDSCKKWFINTYAKYEFVIEFCTDLNKIKSLEKYTGVFIGGGNTFKLLKEVKETGFDKLLKKYLNNNGFVYGGSAGAIIFGKNILTSSHADKNKVNLIDMSGLNLINGYNVWCHYNSKKDYNRVLNLKDKTLVLFEESGILYNGKNFVNFGKECLYFPDDFEKYN